MQPNGLAWPGELSEHIISATEMSNARLHTLIAMLRASSEDGYPLPKLGKLALAPFTFFRLDA